MKTINSMACLSLFLLVGCMNQIGQQRINVERISDIRPSHTTKDEIRTMFGAPLHVTRSAGVEIWVYRYAPESCGETGFQQELVVSFNSDDTVSASSAQ